MDKYTDIAGKSLHLTVSSVKRIQGKAVLTLSDGEILSMPRAMLRERPYRSGMPFDKDSFHLFIQDRSYPFALEKAISLLASRARTEKEITDALRKNVYPETIIARVMQNLHDSGYINDKEFAEHWAASRTSKGLGFHRIRMELRKKGVDQEQIDDVLSQVDEEDLIASAIKSAQKACRGKNMNDPADRQKVIAALARRGFDFSTARAALEKIITRE